jgi:glycosyltransferase involved in cell wall biosynthesis
MVKIVIGNPRTPSKQPYFFEELLISIYSCIKEKGVKFDIIRFADEIDKNNEELHIGIFNFVKLNNLPKKYIMYNIETQNYIDNTIEYKNKLQGANAVINIYNFNLEELKYHTKLYNKMIYIPLTYHISLENMYNVNILDEKNQDIDVLFYGSLNKRRIDIIDILKQSGINIYVAQNYFPDNCFGKDKDNLIERSKIILLLNYYYDDYDMVRATYLLSKKKCIICDDYGYSYILKNMYNNTFPVVKTEELSNNLKILLYNKERRLEIGRNGYEFIKNNLNVENYINPLIELIRN